jgi:cephalosporin hydroxylase
VVEVGVHRGGSAAMWKDYFGPGATIVGIDIDENIKKYTTDGCIQVIGNQGDPAFWDKFLKEYPEIDIFLDDGSHHCQHQILTLEKAWPAVKLGGVYMCEDTHTNYWPEYGGGLKTPSTFLNYAKMVSDTLNSAYYRDLDKHPDNMMFADFYKEVVGMHFYDSVVVLDKGQRETPYNVMSTPYEQ